MLSQEGESKCEHSATLCCGFTCLACNNHQKAFRSKYVAGNAIYASQMSMPKPVILQLLNFPLGPQRVGFLPGTFMPYIDLCADDEISITTDQNEHEYENDGRLRVQGSYAQVGESKVTEEVQRPAAMESTRSIAEPLHLSAQAHLERDQHLPETQHDVSESSTEQVPGLNIQHVNELFAGPPNLCQSSPMFLDPEHPTIGLENLSHPSNLLDTPQKLSCQERKRLVVPMNRPASVTKAMKAWVAKTHYLLDPFREDDECWFHPSPPSGRVTENGTLRPCGKIQKAFAWHDHKGKHSVVLNFGIASKLLLNKLTKQQKSGFISKRWHLSHLCGNWTCLNPAHTTVEPGSVNISRNNCFSHRSGCGHTPQCMKDKKVFLDADGKQVDPSLPAPQAGGYASQASAEWNDWRPDFDEIENDMAMIDTNESGSPFTKMTDDEASSAPSHLLSS